MPPKTRGRAALQAKQLDPDKEEGTTVTVTGKRQKSLTVDTSKDSDTAGSVKRARTRPKAANVGRGVSGKEERPAQKGKKARGGSKTSTQTKKKEKMATATTSRKRRQKAVTKAPTAGMCA